MPHCKAFSFIAQSSQIKQPPTNKGKKMKILDNETGAAIAQLIHNIGAARIMYQGESHQKKCFWLAKEYRAIVELKEKYGIPHCCYESAKRGLQKDYIANASL